MPGRVCVVVGRRPLACAWCVLVGGEGLLALPLLQALQKLLLTHYKDIMSYKNSERTKPEEKFPGS